ncbi:MAG: protein phosphatase [Cyanobium sp.]
MSASALQAILVDFALAELVRSHRDSFPPLWSTESWAKLLIWLALNCSCSGDPADLEAFAQALGPALSRRMRHLFFSRELEDLGLQVLADPAEPQVLVQPLQADGTGALDPERVALALERSGLSERVAERSRWMTLEALSAIPWQEPPCS